MRQDRITWSPNKKRDTTMPHPLPALPVSFRDMLPHLFCDCVPDLNPAHCHRCSRVAEGFVPWSEAPCKTMVESLPYQALLTAEVTDSLLIVSKAFDARRAARAFRATISAPVTAATPADAIEEAPAEEVTTEETPGGAVVMTTSAAAKNPTPLVMPTKPLNRLVSVEEHELARSSAKALTETDRSRRWRFTHLAYGQIQDLGLTPDVIAAILEAPHTVSMAPSGTAVNHHGDGLLIMLSDDDQRVISVVPRENPPAGAATRVVMSAAAHAAAPAAGAVATKAAGVPDAEEAPIMKPAPSTPVPSKPVRRAKSGGPGRKMPSTIKEMLALLTEHGFTTEIGGKGHHMATHAEHPGVSISVPGTPKDRRSYPNTVSLIKRHTGIDITRPR